MHPQTLGSTGDLGTLKLADRFLSSARESPRPPNMRESTKHPLEVNTYARFELSTTNFVEAAPHSSAGLLQPRGSAFTPPSQSVYPHSNITNRT